MKNFWRCCYFVFLSITLCVMIPTICVKAQTDSGIQKNYEYSLEDKTLYSQEPLTIPVQVPSGGQIESINLKFSLKTSPTLLPDRAFYAIAVNGEPFTSGRLNIGESTLIEVEIPTADLTGFNVISISGFLKSTELICEPTDEVNWAIFESDSKASYTVTIQPEITNWLEHVTAPTGEVSIVFPEQPTQFNYEQLLNITTLIEQQQRKQGISVDFQMIGQNRVNQSQPLLVVGSLAQIQEQFSEIFTEDLNQFSGSGGIHYELIDSQWYLFMITDTREQLKNLIDTLSVSGITHQIQQSSYQLQSIEKREITPFQFIGDLTDYGYESQTVSGSGEKGINYYVTTPLKQEVKDAQFTFAIRSSELIAKGESFVEFIVNNQIIRTVQLNSDESIQLITIDLPHELAIQGQWGVQLRFHLFAEELSCITSSATKLWSEVIASESTYTFEMQPREQFFMSVAPGVLQNEQGQAAGVVQFEVESITLKDLVEFITTLTGSAQGIDYLQVALEIDSNQVGNVIIGRSTSPEIQIFTEQTAFRLGNDGRIINQGEVKQEEIFALEQIQFVENKPTVILSAHTAEQMNKLVQQYQQQQLPQQAKSVLLKNDLLIQALGNEPVFNSSNLEEKIDWKVFIPVSLTSIVFIGVSSYLLMKRFKKRN